MQKNRAFMRLFCIITRFWCGRQELKTYDDAKKALIFKAFLLLNANVDAKIFFGGIMILQVLCYVHKKSCFKCENKPNMRRVVFPWRFTYLVHIVS